MKFKLSGIVLATCLLLLSGLGFAQVQIVQSKGADQSIDYASLTQYGPWDDRNYQLTAADIALLPAKDQYLANVPAFFKVFLRKEQPNLGEFYPRSALQYFQIKFGGLMQNGVVNREGLGKHYFTDKSVPFKDEGSVKGFSPTVEVPLATGVAGNEVTVEMNPVNNLLGVAGSNQSGGQTMYYTTDGGTTWQLSATNPSSCCDPTVDWASDGSFVVQADLSSSIGVRAFRSTDNGQTWGTPVVITPNGSDKEFIHVDRSASSPYTDNVYITYHNGNVMQFVRSTDGGVSYQTPISFSGEPTGIGSDITTTPNGDIYYFYPSLNGSGIRLLKSTDGGATFATGTKVADLNGRFDFAIPAMETRRAFIYVSADVDVNTGTIWVAWTDEADDSAGGGTGSAAQTHGWIQVAKSTDQGATWTVMPHPHDTSDSLANNPVDRFHPWLKVGENGVVHVGYYDTRQFADRSGVDFYYAYSVDGLTWSAEQRVSGASSPNLNDGQEWGDYNGLSVVLDKIASTWTDNRSGKVAMAAAGLNPAGSPTFAFSSSVNSFTMCAGDTGFSTDLTVTGLLGYNQPVAISAPSVPTTLSNTVVGVSPVTPTGTSSFSFDAAAMGTTGTSTLTLQAVGNEMPGPGQITRSIDIPISYFSGLPNPQTLTSPADNAINQASNTLLTWAANASAAQYRVEVSDSMAFTTTLFDQTVDASELSFMASGLSPLTSYYWRVTPLNACGTGNTSAIFTFTTADGPVVQCSTPGAAIPDNDPAGVSDDIILSLPGGRILDLDVSIDLTHTYLGDLDIFLENVDTGTSVQLFARSCGTNENMAVILDDSAAAAVGSDCTGSPAAVTGTYQPANPLSAFNSNATSATWRLKVVDNAGADTGTLDEWCMMHVSEQPPELVFASGFEDPVK
ncbi:MAG: proprotein convertase P-domain-containing protein [bacterium]